MQICSFDVAPHKRRMLACLKRQYQFSIIFKPSASLYATHAEEIPFIVDYD
jgi:hypothetical protein